MMLTLVLLILHILLKEVSICAASDTIWAEHTVSLNDFAGKSVYFTFHHTATDMERIMLDNFLVVETNDMDINENDLNNIIFLQTLLMESLL